MLYAVFAVSPPGRRLWRRLQIRSAPEGPPAAVRRNRRCGASERRAHNRLFIGAESVSAPSAYVEIQQFAPFEHGPQVVAGADRSHAGRRAGVDQIAQPNIKKKKHSVHCAQEFGDGSFSRFVRERLPFRVLGEIRKILFNRYLMIRRLLLFVVLIGGLSWTAGTQNVTLKTKNR